jgi:hypothetical protein
MVVPFSGDGRARRHATCSSELSVVWQAGECQKGLEVLYRAAKLKSQFSQHIGKISDQRHAVNGKMIASITQ